MMSYRDDDEDSNDDFMGSMGSYDSQSNPLGLSKAELRKVSVLSVYVFALIALFG